MRNRNPRVQPQQHGSFDAEGFYVSLDAIRAERELTWRQVSAEAGISASTLTRMGQGKRPDVDSLAALAAWAKLDSDQFVRRPKGTEAEPNTLAAIATYLRCDKNLTPEGAQALGQIIQVAYRELSKRS